MPLVERRRLLCVAAAYATLGGCLDEKGNTTLRVRNEMRRDVTLDITAFRDSPGGATPDVPVFNETVTVEATTVEELSVFTRSDQYTVIVDRAGQRLEFDTRPICSDALTQVTVTASGTLTSEVEFCDNVRRTEQSTPHTNTTT